MSANALAAARNLAAQVPIHCGLAHAVTGPLDTIVGNLVGLAYVFAGFAVFAAVALIILLSSNRNARSSMVGTLIWVIGGVLVLSVLGAVLPLVIHTHC
jgi:hypothetical protein